MSSDLIREAMTFSRKRHKGQWRDGADPLPYFTHPVDVVNILRYEAREVDPVVLATGFLHDLVEETDTTAEEVRERFGDEVAELVGQLTRVEPGEDVRAALSDLELWELRNQLLLDEIDAMSPKAQRVKLADRVSNLRGALATREGERLEKYFRQSEMILQRIPRDVCPELWDIIQRMVEANLGKRTTSH